MKYERLTKTIDTSLSDKQESSLVDQIKKDMAREILQDIFNDESCGDLGEFCDTGWIFSIDDARAIANKYGVDLDE